MRWAWGWLRRGASLFHFPFEVLWGCAALYLSPTIYPLFTNLYWLLLRDYFGHLAQAAQIV